MSLLIVNADDYGLTEGISRGILRGHREGIITSTSALALGPAYPKVAGWLADVPSLGLGVHLAAVGEDPPLLTAAEIPSLVGRRGRLCDGYRGFMVRAATGRIDPDDVRREFTAQLHGRRLARAAGRAGLRYPGDAVGIECAGNLDCDRLPIVLARLAAGGRPAVELTVHPGEGDDPDRSRYTWGYRWEDELAALTGPVARDAVARAGFTPGTYAELPPATVGYR